MLCEVESDGVAQDRYLWIACHFFRDDIGVDLLWQSRQKHCGAVYRSRSEIYLDEVLPTGSNIFEGKQRNHSQKWFETQKNRLHYYTGVHVYDKLRSIPDSFRIDQLASDDIISNSYPEQRRQRKRYRDQG